jgi:hypothetical protein
MIPVCLLFKKNDSDRMLEIRDGQVDTGELLDAPVTRPQRGKPTLDALLRASFCRRYDISSFSIFNRWLRRDDSAWQRIRNTLVDALSTVGRRDPFFHWQIRFLESVVRRTRDATAIREQLQALRPALLVSTSCIVRDEDPYIMIAKDLGIPSLGCILSFDNLSSRSMLPVFDSYAVWNGRMRDQLLKYYPDSDSTRIHITGTPQFDFHVREEFRWSRQDTLQRLGLGSGDKYLLYAANSVVFTPTEPKLVAAFARRCAQIPELREHQILVRLHPLDDYQRWKSLQRGNLKIHVRRPWHIDEQVTTEDQARLVNTLRHADVCINMASTMSLDAAAVDTPVICIGFAGQGSGPEDQLCRDIYGTEHYRPIIASGGVRLVQDMDQLVADTVAYVRDRERDRAGRRKLVCDEVGQLDGCASERVADLIARLVHRSAIGDLQRR